MKQTAKMSRSVSQLEHIYNSLNTDFFRRAAHADYHRPEQARNLWTLFRG